MSFVSENESRYRFCPLSPKTGYVNTTNQVQLSEARSKLKKCGFRNEVFNWCNGSGKWTREGDPRG